MGAGLAWGLDTGHTSTRLRASGCLVDRKATHQSHPWFWSGVLAGDPNSSHSTPAPRVGQF